VLLFISKRTTEIDKNVDIRNKVSLAKKCLLLSNYVCKNFRKKQNYTIFL